MPVAFEHAEGRRNLGGDGYRSGRGSKMGGGMGRMNSNMGGMGGSYNNNMGGGFNNNSNMGGGNYGYTNMNWTNYQMQQYNMNKMYLDQYIPTIFEQFDSNRTGTIEMHEFPGMVTKLFKCMNMSPPSQNDMWYLMWRFDQDKNGKIDYMEWANMVYTLGGLKN